ncbi:response regulator transcription factor [bacterium]|nr:response regulator transcription factor [bacterium]
MIEILSIAIVEDEENAYTELQTRIAKYEIDKGIKIEIDWFKNAELLVDKFQSKYDAIFLDIDLPGGMNGIQAAKRIREVDDSVIIIFVTNMKQYVVSGYEVSALNYIIKPIKYQALHMSLDKIIRISELTQNNHILIKTSGYIERVNINSIYYIDIYNHVLTIHTTTKKIETYSTLSDFENRLKDNFFFKINNYTLVNLRHVKRFTTKEIIISNGDNLQISRRRRKDFLDSLVKYSGEIL